MAQIQDTSTPDPSEMMADDLEKAQRARFHDANRDYEFFLQTHEVEVLNQIHEFRNRSRFPIRRRRGPYAGTRE